MLYTSLHDLNQVHSTREAVSLQDFTPEGHSEQQVDDETFIEEMKEHLIAQSQEFQMWGKVTYRFAAILADWRRRELWRHVAPSWEAFVLQYVKLSQDFVNELCELAERVEAKRQQKIDELEPFLPCSPQAMAKRIRQYLEARPHFAEINPQNRGLDICEFVDFDLEEFRVYIWFEYVITLEGKPHHFSRPWIDSIDFQLCGSGYGEGLYSWLNISESNIQLRHNTSPSTLKVWNDWAKALQEELARSLVPSGLAIQI